MPGGTVVAATIDKPVNMDPAFAELYSSMQVYQNIFNKLVYVDANYNFIPGLAKTLDPGRSADLGVRARRERLLPQRRAVHRARRRLHDGASSTLALAAPNAVFLQAIERVETDGDYKARFKLQQSVGVVPLRPGAGAARSSTRTAIASGDPRLDPIGTGPFRMTEWVQDDHVTLERVGEVPLRRAAVPRQGHFPGDRRRHGARDRDSRPTRCSG